MNNFPLKPLQPHHVGSTKTRHSDPIAPEQKSAPISTSSGGDAATVNVPRTHLRNSLTADPAEPLASLVETLKSSGSLEEAHSGLDASRVFDLLNDKEES